MNLINDAWIPIIRKDGTKERIAPYQIAETENPVIEIDAPRPDFQGALYQFLIGLLQTTFAPEDQDEWQDFWGQGLEVEKLKNVFSHFSSAFDLYTENTPAFMQDFDLPDGKNKPLADLLIEAPGEKTRKDNLDHFVKAGTVSGMCESCTATALFTLQINAPSGGVGYRVGVRGGGPLTTLLMPESTSCALWKKLWINILTEEELSEKLNEPDKDTLPWMAATRLSDKTGSATLPEDTSLLQVYWGMPRRIRLEHSEDSGICDLCGNESNALYTHYRTKNYGVNYEGTWVHPLTPYRFDPKKEKPPLSLKGQQGGLGYRHWLGLNWLDSENGDQAALSIKAFNEERFDSLKENIGSSELVTLWCFGYDMDNMKARCWYEHTMPVVAISKYYRPLFIQLTGHLISAAKDVIRELRSQVKSAWFNRPKDAKGDTSMVDKSFWDATEATFYQQLRNLANQPDAIRTMPTEVAEQWLTLLRQQAYRLFDQWVIEGDAEDMNMKRITKARRILGSKLKSMESLKHLEQIASAKEEAA